MSISNRIIIVDAYNLFTRHYVAHPGMSKNGEQVGGVVGFFNNIIRLVERINEIFIQNTNKEADRQS